MTELTNKTTELTKDITEITAEINAYQRIAGEAIFEIGRRLKHVKENDLIHGEWTEFCRTVRMDVRQANKFIRVVDELGGEWSTSTTLGMEALYQIATLPPEHREATHTTAKGETKTPDEMTVRELRELKRRLRQAEQATEAERKERERLEEENEELSGRLQDIPETEEPQVIRKKDAQDRKKFYEEFADDLEYITEKYGSIVFDGEQLKAFGEQETDYARKVNAFDDFWKRYVKVIIEDQIIIEAESV